MAFDDLARARIRDGIAIGPSTRGAMHPLDDVVADIHRVSIRGQDFDAKCVAVSGSFERLVPPARAVKQCGTHGFWRARVHIIDDRLDRLTDRSRWVFFLQTVADDEPLFNFFSDGRAVVCEHMVDEPATGIERARLVVAIRQLNERVVFAYGDERWIRCDFTHPVARFIAGERECGFDFCILRKVLCHRQIDCRAGRILAVRSLSSTLQSLNDTMRVVEPKIRSIHEHVAVVFVLSACIEAPEYRLRKSVLHALPLSRADGAGTETEILLHEQNFRSNTLEADNARFAELSTIKADIIRADAGGERIKIKKIGIPFIDLEPELAAGGVPIKVEVSGQLLHRFGLLYDGCQRRGFAARRGLWSSHLRIAECDGREQHQNQSDGIVAKSAYEWSAREHRSLLWNEYEQ